MSKKKNSKKQDPEKKTKNKDSKQQTQDVNDILTEDPIQEEKSDEQALLQEQNQKLQTELSELKDKYLRKVAEFENYKKRTLKERLDLMQTAAKDTILAILPVLDDFDRAIKAGEAEESTEPVSEGIKLLYRSLHKKLEIQGLQVMESDGLDFDPELHEALTEIPAPDESLQGKIIDTIEKGYMLRDKIIRHARVVVGK